MPSKKRRRSSSFRRERHKHTYNCKMSLHADTESRYLPQVYPDWDEALNEAILQEIVANKASAASTPRVSPTTALAPSQTPSPKADQPATTASTTEQPTDDAVAAPIRFALQHNGKFDNEFQDKLRQYIQILLTHHVKSEQIDCTDRSMYTGLPGISLLYHHLSTITSFSSKMREELASKATHHVNQYVTSIQSQHCHNNKCPSFLNGDLGVYTLSAIVRNQQRLHREALLSRTLSDPGSVTLLSSSTTSNVTTAPTSTISMTAAIAAAQAPATATGASLSPTPASQQQNSNSTGNICNVASTTAAGQTTGTTAHQSNFIIEQINNEPETSLQLDKILELIKMQEAPGTPDELLYGRAGGLYALMLIKQQLPKQTIVKDEHIINQISLILKSGQTMESFGRPLFYAWHGKEYVGAAHGYAGILFMLLEAHQYLSEDQLKLVRDAVDFVEGIKYPSNNYPSSIGSQTDQLVHWCHGAPGVLYMLAKSYQVYGDQRYLESALACGEVIWQRGLLKKGFGLCHGISGNGYAFVRLYQLTKDLKHLYRAGKFAQFYMEHKSMINWRADSPASLFEGYAGLCIYLSDLLNPDAARFPAFQLTT